MVLCQWLERRWIDSPPPSPTPCCFVAQMSRRCLPLWPAGGMQLLDSEEWQAAPIQEQITRGELHAQMIEQLRQTDDSRPPALPIDAARWWLQHTTGANGCRLGKAHHLVFALALALPHVAVTTSRAKLGPSMFHGKLWMQQNLWHAKCKNVVDIARLPCPFHLFQLPLGCFHEMEQQVLTIVFPTLSELLRIDLITDPICVWQAPEELCTGGALGPTMSRTHVDSRRQWLTLGL